MFGSKPGDPALEEVAGGFTVPTPVPTLYLHGSDDGVMGIETVVEDELRPFFPRGSSSWSSPAPATSSTSRSPTS